jgi:hypothetical protein
LILIFREFQFGFTETSDLLNNIAIWSLQAPILFILNSTDYRYSVIYFNTTKVTDNEDINSIIQNILDKKIEVLKKRKKMIN